MNNIFELHSVAIVAASERENSVGALVLSNIRESGFAGDIYPVNPRHQKVQGLKAYASISAIDRAVDLVIIAIPAKVIPAVMRKCGVGSVIILSAGFAEVGKAG